MKLFEVPEICVIVSKASGVAQVPNRRRYGAVLQNLWGQNYSFKSKLGSYTWEKIKNRTQRPVDTSLTMPAKA